VPKRHDEFPRAVNSLGETICLGCGDNMGVTRRVYCGNRCDMRIYRQGGRLSFEEVAGRIEGDLPSKPRERPCPCGGPPHTSACRVRKSRRLHAAGQRPGTW